MATGSRYCLHLALGSNSCFEGSEGARRIAWPPSPAARITDRTLSPGLRPTPAPRLQYTYSQTSTDGHAPSPHLSEYSLANKHTLLHDSFT